MHITAVAAMNDLQIFFSFGTVSGDLPPCEPIRGMELQKTIGNSGVTATIPSLKRQSPNLLRHNIRQILSGQIAIPETKPKGRLRSVPESKHANRCSAIAGAPRISLVDHVKLPESVGAELMPVYKKRILLKEELANQVLRRIGSQAPAVRAGVQEYYTR